MDYSVIFTDTAIAQAKEILDYLYFELRNVQAT